MAGNYISAYDAKAMSQVTCDDLNFDTDGDYNAWLDDMLIPYVEGLVERHCGVPSAFFVASGTAISNELHDYHEKYIKLKYRPVISISKVELNGAGCGSTPSWTQTSSYTENLSQGIIRIVTVSPTCHDQGVRVSYTPGYSTIPPTIEYVSTQLISNVLQALVQRKVSPTIRVDDSTVRLVIPKLFDQELKDLLKPYKQMGISLG